MAYPKLTTKPGALDTAAAIRAGELKPTEAVDAAIVRIEELDVHVNALAVGDFERAIATAHQMDKQTPRADQPLFGVPMTVKESFDVAGLPTTYGYADCADHVATEDSEVVSRLKAAGAIIVGKTNVPEDLTDWQSFNPVYGRTNNPHDHARSAGGSSGGSAAAVASGMVACEFGTDIGSSIRVPAHFCGVWGHRTTWGVVSKRGHQSPRSEVLQHDGALSVAGPFARNADDLAALLRITASHPLAETGKPLSQCRVLAILEHPISRPDSSVREPMEAAIAALESAGVAVACTSDLVPDLAEQHANYLRLMNTSMARGAPNREGKRASATDWFEMLDRQAQNQRAWAALFAEFDFVLAPPAPVLAIPHLEGSLFKGTFEIDGEQVNGATGLAWSGLATYPDLPATVVPIGASEVGGSTLPCGMQVIGPRYADLDCIAAAKAIDEIVNG
ncbi:amidase family protein [Altererythrobacter arenosus]|uniref:Amidase family protein n=1 Tax=Altererythrobacter arenosus TaxID=3032592 RepID=A0ABY8FRZ6_9SPHN|nr:amidase family protein [Altererythrobacter sp. CAU 1644]WFL76683.1 amidase family protein [Altererythrobacter sp. CAU 1644]